MFYQFRVVQPQTSVTTLDIMTALEAIPRCICTYHARMSRERVANLRGESGDPMAIDVALVKVFVIKE